MVENKMTEVAMLFGKKLGEEFHIRLGKTVMKVKWTHIGLMCTDFAGKWWPCAYANALLIGEAVIVSAEGKPYSKD